MQQEKKLSKEEARLLDIKYEQYCAFTVMGIGFDDSDIKVSFKKASHAIGCFNMTIKIGFIVATPAVGKGKVKIMER